ncbi:MAG: 5-(carboxyamino)imidazole ribonucleotide synthase, partial [Hyphomicrobium sp.]
MSALPPGSTIGILGGGQLGRMLSLAAARLGLKCHVYSDVPGGAADVAAASTVAPYENTNAVRAFAGSVDVVTYEFENVPLAAAAAAGEAAPIRPGPKALAVAQDRLKEKSFVSALGIPVAPFAAVDDDASRDAALLAIGESGILKTRRFGYDGKGQVRIRNAAELAPAFETLRRAPSVLEGLVPFAYEVSVLVVRSLAGEIRTYDIPLNTHKDGILDTSTVPSPLPPAHAARASDIAGAIATALDYVGVLGVEMFYLPDAPEPLVVNEIAPRVHNSGHWTMDACLTSQFENHIR